MIKFVLRYHHLKLYPEDESGPMSTKKPVVVELFDDVVFSEPSESFLARVQNHPAVTFPKLPAGFTLPPPGIYLSFILRKKNFRYHAFDNEPTSN